MKKTGQAAVQRERRSRESSLVQQVGMQRAYCLRKITEKISAWWSQQAARWSGCAESLLSAFSQAVRAFSCSISTRFTRDATRLNQYLKDMVLVSHWLYQCSEDGVKAFCIEILKYLKPLANLKRSEAMESSHRLSLSHLRNLWSRLFECLLFGLGRHRALNRQLFNYINSHL